MSEMEAVYYMSAESHLGMWARPDEWKFVDGEKVSTGESLNMSRLMNKPAYLYPLQIDSNL